MPSLAPQQSSDECPFHGWRNAEARLAEWAGERQEPAVVLVVNIVGLAFINDRYGWQRGDSLLRAMHQGIAAVVGQDSVFHAASPPDAFVVMLASTTDDSISAVRRAITASADHADAQALAGADDPEAMPWWVKQDWASGRLGVKPPRRVAFGQSVGPVDQALLQRAFADHDRRRG